MQKKLLTSDRCDAAGVLEQQVLIYTHRRRSGKREPRRLRYRERDLWQGEVHHVNVSMVTSGAHVNAPHTIVESITTTLTGNTHGLSKIREHRTVVEIFAVRRYTGKHLLLPAGRETGVRFLYTLPSKDF